MDKKYIDTNNKTGRGRRDFEFTEAMEEILGKKRNINPVLLLGSDTVDHLTPVDCSGSSKSVDDENEIILSENVKGDVKGKCRARRKQRINVVKDMRNERKKFYERYLDIEERKLKESQRMNDIQEKRNGILEKLFNQSDEVQHLGTIV